MERVVQNQKLSRTAIHPHCIKNTEVLLDALKIKFNGHVVVFLTKSVLQLLRVMVLSVVNNVPVAKNYFRMISVNT